MSQITININETAHKPTRRHVSIPNEDLWTDEWWESQVNPSGSVRKLIQDDIARHGMSDVIYRAKYGTGSVTVAHGVATSQPAAARPQAPGSNNPAAVLVDPMRFAQLEREVLELRETLKVFAALNGHPVPVIDDTASAGTDPADTAGHPFPMKPEPVIDDHEFSAANPTARTRA